MSLTGILLVTQMLSLQFLLANLHIKQLLSYVLALIFSNINISTVGLCEDSFW